MERLITDRIVTPKTILENGWIGIEYGRIAAIESVPRPSAAQVDDHGGALILPGVIDGQTHATSYRGLAGIEERTAAAVACGVTTLVDMPYDNPNSLDRPDRLRAKIDAFQTHAHADVALYGTVTVETGTDHIASLIQGGVVAFKISSFESSPTRSPRIGADLPLDLLEALAPTGVPVGLHNEDQEIVLTRVFRARANGVEGTEAHAMSRPVAAELATTAAFHALGQACGAHTHPVHLTSGEGFSLTQRFAARNARATGELCVHYLWFDAPP